MTQPSAPSKGFSLVELSIVLVILGLLVGGILAGRSLIRASELRSVVNDFNRFRTATMAFRDKYFALPGDMTNATSFWGAADAGDGLASDCGDTISTTATTCNGDGNNQIDALQSGIYERYRMWQHLANAGLIEGVFAGSPSAGNAYVGQHYPASRFPSGGYEGSYFSTAIYGNPNGHPLKLAKRSASDTIGLNGALLSAEEAWNIDGKMDDGLSNGGKVVALDASDVAGCVTNGTTRTPGTVGSYILTNNFASCRLYYFPGY